MNTIKQLLVQVFFFVFIVSVISKHLKTNSSQELKIPESMTITKQIKNKLSALKHES